MPGLEEAAVPNRSLYQSLAYNNPISQYVGTADLSAPIEKLQSQRDKADLASGFVKPLQSMPHDIDRAKASDKYYKDKIEEITKYDDPYAQYRAVRKLGQQYADDSTSGERGHITQSYNNYNKAREEAQKKFDEGHIDEYGFWKAVEQPLNSWKGTTPNNKGGYNVFQGGKVGKYEDMAKGASDFAQQWSADKGFKATVDGGYINENTYEFVSKDEVLKQTYNYLATNPKFEAQLSHYKEFHGKNGEDKKHQLLMGIAEPIANREAFDKYDGNMKDDPFSTYMRKKQIEEEENNKINTTNTTKLDVEAPDLIPAGYIFDKGELKAKSKGSMFPQASYSEAKTGIVNGNNNSNEPKWDKDLEKKKINQLAYKLGLDVNMSLEAKYNAILKHQETNKERSLTGFRGTPSTQNFLTDLTFRNGSFNGSEFKYGNKTFKDADSFAQFLIESKNLPDNIDKDLGSVKEYIRKNATVDSTIPGIGRYGSQTQASHKSSINGLEFFVSSDKETGEALRSVNELQNQIFNPKEAGKPVRFIDPTDGHIDYITVAFNNGEAYTKIVDKNGKDIPEYKGINIPIAELGKKALEFYQKSNYPSGVHAGTTKTEETLGN